MIFNDNLAKRYTRFFNLSKLFKIMYVRSNKSRKRNCKMYVGNAEAARALRNSLSDFVLTQSRNNRKLTWRDSDKEILGLFSRRVQSLPATGGWTKSIAIDRDKRLGRKRRSNLDAYMNTLLPIKKKSTTCIPLSCSRESRNGSAAVAFGADGARVLSNISEIDKEISTRTYFRSNNDTRFEGNGERLIDQDSRSEKVLTFIRTSEGFRDETSGDESADASDLHLIELSKNGKIDEIHRKSFTEASYVELQPCSSKAEKKEISIKGKRSMRNSRIEGKSLKVKKSDLTEIQHDVSGSAANVARGAIEESSMTIESACPPIKRAVYHQFVTSRISRDKIVAEKEKSAAAIGNNRVCQSRDCVRHGEIANSRIFPRRPNSCCSLNNADNDRVHTRTLADKPSTSFTPKRGKLRKDVGGAASGENAKVSEGVHLDEDYHFLMSFHRQLNEMPLVRKMKVKARIQTMFYEELRARICDQHAAS